MNLKGTVSFVLILLFKNYNVQSESKFEHEKRITFALRELLLKTTSDEVLITFDTTNVRLATNLLKDLEKQYILSQAHQINDLKNMEKHCNLTSEMLRKRGDVTEIFVVSHQTAKNYMEQVKKSELGGRNLRLIFIWQNWPSGSQNLAAQTEAVRIAVYSWYSNSNIFKLFSTHSYGKKPTKMYQINAWNNKEGFTHIPVFVPMKEVFSNMKGRFLRVPVLHKPPWYFVKKEGNVSLEVVGGRDHQLLKEIASRMNFKYKYLDPTEKSQGIPTGSGKAGRGVLSLLRKRQVDLFLGDATITYERTLDLDFSFFTMADNVAFITHSPQPLSEAWALVRPFHWEVWLAVWLSIALIGPALRLISKNTTLGDCVWATTSIILKQSTREVGTSNKTRLVTIMLSITATYVIGDLYCANLTSLLAKPGRESPLNTLNDLAKALYEKRVDCLVEGRSSGAEFLKNGTREAQKIWRFMQRQRTWMVPSVEKGVALVRAKQGLVLIAGRETLQFEMQRFGQRFFHLSDPLSTQYSAIALQQGCPYFENINEILMWLFEAGILDKMTATEYARLGSQRKNERKMGEILENVYDLEAFKTKPLSMQMLQGAFIVLFFGSFLGVGVLAIEVTIYKKCKRIEKRKQLKRGIRISVNFLTFVVSKIVE
ncbi:ionotropic receptor 40a [Neocloeon triangulifer]|uniref:ionotropic receptor 40a n=1 Tax=Neocloeon triangulifer TaxID=2078957 RepID=UPI00286F64D1|nr:ionotropic receptor 40a [Neocloeon triangulifer]